MLYLVLISGIFFALVIYFSWAFACGVVAFIKAIIEDIFDHK